MAWDRVMRGAWMASAWRRKTQDMATTCQVGYTSAWGMAPQEIATTWIGRTPGLRLQTPLTPHMPYTIPSMPNCKRDCIRDGRDGTKMMGGRGYVRLAFLHLHCHRHPSCTAPVHRVSMATAGQWNLHLWLQPPTPMAMALFPTPMATALVPHTYGNGVAPYTYACGPPHPMTMASDPHTPFNGIGPPHPMPTAIVSTGHAPYHRPVLPP